MTATRSLKAKATNARSYACVKAFTNPIPDEGEAIRNVQFSLLEGPVISGDKLELTGEGEIYYQITGSDGTVGEITPYTGAITLEGPCTCLLYTSHRKKEGIPLHILLLITLLQIR